MITWDLPKKGCEKRFGYVNFDMFLRAKYSDWKVLGCKQGYESMVIYDGPPKWWSDSAQKIVQIWFKYYWYGFISKNTSMVLRLVKVVTQLLIKELRKKGRHDYFHSQFFRLLLVKHTRLSILQLLLNVNQMHMFVLNVFPKFQFP